MVLGVNITAGAEGRAQGVQDFAQRTQVREDADRLRRERAERERFEQFRSSFQPVAGLQMPQTPVGDMPVARGEFAEPAPEITTRPDAVPEVSVEETRPVDMPKGVVTILRDEPISTTTLFALPPEEPIQPQGADESRSDYSERVKASGLERQQAANFALRTFRQAIADDGLLRGITGPQGRERFSPNELQAMGFSSQEEYESLVKRARSSAGRSQLTDYLMARPSEVRQFQSLDLVGQLQYLNRFVFGETAEAAAPTANASEEIVQAAQAGGEISNEQLEQAYQETSQTGRPLEDMIAMDQFYLADPNAIPFEIQHMMEHREFLRATANAYLQLGTPESLLQYQNLLMEIRNTDLGLFSAMGMQGIQEMSQFNDPRRLSTVWSQASGQNIQILPRQDGLFDIATNGQVRHSGWSLDDVASQAQMSISSQARQQYAANQQARFESALELEQFTAQKFAEAQARIYEAFQTLPVEQAKTMAKNAGMEVVETMEGTFLVARDMGGNVQMAALTPGQEAVAPGLIRQGQPATPMGAQPSISFDLGTGMFGGGTSTGIAEGEGSWWNRLLRPNQ